ncbi:MAG: MFS transporter [Microbacteriaceae bacterium]
MSTAAIDLSTVTAPIPVATERPRWRDTFDALRARNYRLYVGSQLLANTGGWMQRIATDWLVLQLTGNVALVGLTVAAQFTPMIVLGAWAGVLADRVSRRRILIITQSLTTVLCALLAVLALTGLVEAWHVLLIVLTLGVVQAIDGPSRSAFVTEMVGQHRVRNAVSLNASIFHLGGLVGPALSGVLIVLIGAGWSIGVNAVTSLIVVMAFVAMRRRDLVPVARAPRRAGQIREAIRYAMAKPGIRWSLILLSFVSVFGMSLPILLAASANTTYETGAAGYGIYSSLAAVGALTGAILSTRRRTLRLRSIVVAVAAYGIVTMLAGATPVYAVFLGALVGIGCTRLLFATAAESMTQLSSNLMIRGRIMSLYLIVLVGGQALGGLVMGAIAEVFGSQVALLIAGGIPLAAAIVIGLVLASRRQLTIRVGLRGARIVPSTRGRA